MFTLAIIYLLSQSVCTVLRENPEFMLRSMHTPLECSEPCENIICPPHSADHILLSSSLEKVSQRQYKVAF